MIGGLVQSNMDSQHAFPLLDHLNGTNYRTEGQPPPHDRTAAPLYFANSLESLESAGVGFNNGIELDTDNKTATGAIPRSATELLTGEGEQLNPNSPIFQTDEFRMYSFKVDDCPMLCEAHEWADCPYLHPGEKARRRDPRVWTYGCVPCPEFRKGVCKRGDSCHFAHGVFECWLHPARYRTTLCKEGAACTRSVCFFAHTVDQLREPTVAGPLCGSGGPASPQTAPPPASYDPPATPASILQGILASTGNSSRSESPGSTPSMAGAQSDLLRLTSLSSFSSAGSIGTPSGMDSFYPQYGDGLGSTSTSGFDPARLLMRTNDMQAAAVDAAAAARAAVAQKAAAQEALQRILQALGRQQHMGGGGAFSSSPAGVHTPSPFADTSLASDFTGFGHMQ